MPGYITIAQALANEPKIKRRTLRRWIAEGRLQCHVTARNVTVIDLTEFVALAEQRDTRERLPKRQS